MEEVLKNKLIAGEFEIFHQLNLSKPIEQKIDHR